MIKIFAVGFASIISLASFLQSPFLTVKSAWFNHPQTEQVLVTRAPLPVVPAVTVRKAVISRVKTHSVQAVRDDRMSLTGDAAPAFLCRFSGRATLNGLPAAHAQVFFRVTTSLTEERRSVQTAADGTYALNFTIKASANDPIDWEIQAQTADMKVAQVSGRQILMGDEQVVSIDREVAFQAD